MIKKVTHRGAGLLFAGMMMSSLATGCAAMQANIAKSNGYRVMNDGADGKQLELMHFDVSMTVPADWSLTVQPCRNSNTKECLVFYYGLIAVDTRQTPYKSLNDMRVSLKRELTLFEEAESEEFEGGYEIDYSFWPNTPNRKIGYEMQKQIGDRVFRCSASPKNSANLLKLKAACRSLTPLPAAP